MSTGGVKSAQRALEIIELLTARGDAMTFTEISEATGLPRASLHGLLRTLVAKRWLNLGDDRRYSLGIRTWEAGTAYLRGTGLNVSARPRMERLRDALDETVQLAVLEDRDCVYIDKVQGGRVLVLASDVGRRLPAYATGVGKVLLAGLDDRVFEQLFAGAHLERFTEHTISTVAELRRELDRIRARGWATDEEEYSIGVRCVAVPIRDNRGDVIAAMSVSAPAIRFGTKQREAALRMLRDAAAEVSAELGYRALAAHTGL
jgi:DNA-binding IclR family transcriptional regulator